MPKRIAPYPPMKSPVIPRESRVGQCPEMSVDIRHQLLDHEVFPVSRDWGIHIPRAPQRSRHISTHKNKIANDVRTNRSIQKPRRPVTVKGRTIPLRRSVIAGREIDHHLAHRARANLVAGEVYRTGSLCSRSGHSQNPQAPDRQQIELRKSKRQLQEAPVEEERAFLSGSL